MSDSANTISIEKTIQHVFWEYATQTHGNRKTCDASVKDQTETA